MKAILGTKIGMTQILAEDGILVPITLVKAGPCTITQLKTDDTDGYIRALQPASLLRTILQNGMAQAGQLWETTAQVMVRSISM